MIETAGRIVNSMVAGFRRSDW